MNTLEEYKFPKKIIEVSTNEEIMINPDQIITIVLDNKVSEQTFIDIKRINEKKIIYPIENIIDICAEFMSSKV